MANRELARLRLLQLTSPNLPTGAFAYSQGLEWACDCGWVNNFDHCTDWLQSLLKESISYLELPLLIRLYHAAAADDRARFQHCSDWLMASRETSELRHEEQQRAWALMNLLQQLPDSQLWPKLASWQNALRKSQLGSYALAAHYWHIPVSELLMAYSWSWLENAVNTAIKLVPLGQSDGQQLLYRLSPEIVPAIAQACALTDDDIGPSTQAQAIACSRHESQYSRLFRS